MSEKARPILMTGWSVQRILADAKTKIYPRKGESPSERNHLIRRLLNGIQTVTVTDCWVWGKHINNKGYGKLTVERKGVYAHRLSYKLFKGEIPEKLFVCHTCDNSSCINPEHLFLGTQSDNMIDCAKKGRINNIPVSFPRERNPMAKLNINQVEEIRKSNKKQAILAEIYNISQSQISDIKRGKAWQ